jgi:nicotinamide-nucleotide amidase
LPTKKWDLTHFVTSTLCSSKSISQLDRDVNGHVRLIADKLLDIFYNSIDIMVSLAQEIGNLLRKKGLTLGAVESATGGLISHLITNVQGSSEYYKGSVTSYSGECKIKVVGVKAETIEKHGEVSHQVAEEMAQGGRKVLSSDVCIADTGIAGPTGATPSKPVGLFYLGLSHKDGTYSQKHIFTGNREQNKRSAAEAALTWLKEYLLGLK